MSAPCPTYGFTLALVLHEDVESGARDALRGAMRELLESRGLCDACVGDDAGWRHVISSEAAQATDADREALREWAASRLEIASCVVSPLVDIGDTGVT